MNYYEHHLGDYAEATSHLSFVEDAAYSRCIRKYYSSESPLPADVKQVQRLVGARTKEEREAVQTVLDEFFKLEADGWHNRRCDDEIARYQDKRNKAKGSANARWNAKRSDSDGNANASETHSERNAEAMLDEQCDGNALQSPISSLQSPDSKSSDTSSPPLTPVWAAAQPAVTGRERKVSTAEPPEFAEIRQTYPRRAGSQRWGDAAKHYRKRRDEGVAHEVILAGIQRYARFLQATGETGTKTVQQAATFLGENRGYLEPWAPPPPAARPLSAVERVRLANGATRDDRVVAEQRNGSSFEHLDLLDGDVREPVHTGVRRLGS